MWLPLPTLRKRFFVSLLCVFNSKIETVLPAKNSNRLAELFSGNKAVKTALWFSDGKNVVCLQFNVVCLF
jgi:hypothetical protein